MKPLAGGRIKNIGIAFKYLWQLPDVVMLPGIKAIREVEEIVQVLKKPRLTQAEQKEMQRLREKLSPRFCRHCDYCLPCPQGIPVSMVMDYEAITMGFPPDKLYSGHFTEPFEKAARCDECGECEPKCPYDMPVVSMVTEFARKYHENKKKYEAGLKH
jgi:predicted aldo/keto reductase-like oxidoreductase